MHRNALAYRIFAAIGGYISAPFAAGLWMFAALFIMNASMEAAFEIRYRLSDLRYIIAVIFGFTYLQTFIVTLFKGKARNWIFAFMALFSAAWCMIDIVCMIVYESRFDDDYAFVVAGTNPAEVTEYLTSFMSVPIAWRFALILASAALAAWIAYEISKRLDPRLGYIGLIGVAVACLAIKKMPTVCEVTPPGKIYKVLHPWQFPHFADFHTEFDVTRTSATRPKSIVVLIGESYDKHHSSLYGYPLPTNPRLGALGDSNLLVYSQITCPHVYTDHCLEQMMSTYDGNRETNPYECLTIPRLMNEGGYTTLWISNQGQGRLYDAEIVEIARQCDTVKYVSEKSSRVFSYLYDEELIPEIDRQRAFNPDSAKCWFIHFIGSHEVFDKRFPADRAHFKASDYPQLPPSQRQPIADYDNSVLYNDSVVSQIISRFRDEDAIIIYLSDHGMDLFYTDPSFIGHGKFGIPASREIATQIPMMIYATDRYIATYPDLYEALAASRDNPWNNRDLIYTLAQIARLDFKGNLPERSLTAP